MRRLIFTALAVATLAGCSAPPAVAPAKALPFKPTASLQELMLAVIDPAADALWESVSTEVTRQGIKEIRPETEEAWQKLRHQAVILQEGANALLIEGRPVVRQGKEVDDAHVAGVLKAADIATRWQAQRESFNGFALALHQNAEELLTAIDARDVPAIIAAGSRLEHVCESCHSTFWYPDAKRPLADGTLASPSDVAAAKAGKTTPPAGNAAKP